MDMPAPVKPALPAGNRPRDESFSSRDFNRQCRSQF
jgi:hypothetical protein